MTGLRKMPSALLLFSLVGLSMGAATASEYVVRAKKIYRGDGTSATMMRVADGKVLEIGDTIDTTGRDVLDLGDGVVIPGLVAAETRTTSRSAGEESIGAQYMAYDGYDFFANQRGLLSGGVTTIYLDPGRTRLMSGQGAVIKTAGAGPEQRTLKGGADLVVNFASAAMNPPPINVLTIPPSFDNPHQPAIAQTPGGRISMERALKDALAAAKVYTESRRTQGVEWSASMDALSEALGAKRPMRIRAERADDVWRAIQFAGTLDSPVIISSSQCAHFARTLKEKGLAVILEPLDAIDRLPGNIGERDVTQVFDFDTARSLEEHGVLYTVGSGTTPSRLMEIAAHAVNAGADPGQILKAVTANAAEILGVQGRVGSLSPGLDADFVVLGDEPFSPTSQVRSVFVDGRRVYETKSQALVVRADTVVTGTGEVFSPGAVLFDGDRIASVGPWVSAPRGARVIDGGKGSYLVPGFVDAQSHLGLMGDTTSADSDLPLDRAIGGDDRESRRVARAGVTSVVLTPSRSGSRGARASWIRTAGESGPDRVVEPIVALKFSALRIDPVEGTRAFDANLKKGKAYFDKWKKYEEALAKWEAAQKGGEVEAPKPPPEPKKEESASGNKTEKRTDPVTGKWEATLSGELLPEPQDAILMLKLDSKENTIAGTFGRDDDDSAPLVGTLKGDQVKLELQVEGPPTPPTINATLTRPDYMKGTFDIMEGLGFEFEATRTEKDAVDVVIVSRKRTKKAEASDKPKPPPVDEKLEPYRLMFKGEAVALIEAATKAEMKAILEVFTGTYGIQVVFSGATESYRLLDELKSAGAGVVLRPPFDVRKSDASSVNLARVLTAHGIPTAIQSDAGDSARGLATLSASNVREGLDPYEAIKMLTSYPAELFQVSDRIGSLEPGKAADAVLFTGPPFDLRSRVSHVFVRGRELENE